MRSFPILVAVLFCACNVGVDKEASSPKDRATPPTASRPPATAPAGSVPAFSSGLRASDDGADGVAELRQLTAAHRMIAMDRVDEDSVSAAEFTPNVASAPSAYGGDYHFGDSEWESNLALTVEGTTITGVLSYGSFENEKWVGEEVRFEGGTINGASFSAPGWKGVFVLYNGERGVIILRNPTDQIGVQYGNKL